MWKQQFLQKMMTTGRPHLKDFGDKTWQQAALEVGMDWAKLTEKEREEQARQQAAAKKKKVLLAAKERALATYKEASQPAPKPQTQTVKPIDPKTTAVPYPEQQKQERTTYKDPAVFDETVEKVTPLDVETGARSAIHKKLEMEGELLNKQLQKPKPKDHQ